MVGGTFSGSVVGSGRVPIPRRTTNNPTNKTTDSPTTAPSRSKYTLPLDEYDVHCVHASQSFQVHFVVQSSIWFSHHPSHFGGGSVGLGVGPAVGLKVGLAVGFVVGLAVGGGVSTSQIRAQQPIPDTTEAASGLTATDAT
jgi:hypothetical protein